MVLLCLPLISPLSHTVDDPVSAPISSVKGQTTSNFCSCCRGMAFELQLWRVVGGGMRICHNEDENYNRTISHPHSTTPNHKYRHSGSLLSIVCPHCQSVKSFAFPNVIINSQQQEEYHINHCSVSQQQFISFRNARLQSSCTATYLPIS